MKKDQNSPVIYGDSPFIEDMGVLTTLCLLHDEVILFGTKSLDAALKDYRAKAEQASNSTSLSLVEQIFLVLQPEGVVSFLSPADAAIRFAGMNEIEIPGIEGFERVDKDGKKFVVPKVSSKELNDLSRMVLKGVKKGERTVSDLIRDISLIGAAAVSRVPIVCEAVPISLTPSSRYVSEVAMFLAHKTLQRLVLPELCAYHTEDILEARLKLKGELQVFKAAILELVWLLHQRTELSNNFTHLSGECDILIDTKITSAVLLLEKAISDHKNKRIRRILRTTGGALLELGKSLLAPTLAGVLMGGSGALLKLSEGLESQEPSIQIASFIYKVRQKLF